MTDIVNPPAAPTVPPYPALGSANFNSEAYTYGSNMPGVVAGIQAMVQATWTNATAANERASAAAGSASAADTQANLAMGYRNTAGNHALAASGYASTAKDYRDQADASRIEASKLNLGNKTAPPTTDNQGQAIRAGATYYDTSANKWRVWTGSAWGDGVSAVAGVASLNGKTGPLNIATLAGYGITNFRADEGLPENVNLASVVTSGIYRYNTASDNPPGILYSPLLVFRSVDTCAQMLVDYLSGAMFVRSGVIIDGVLVDATTRAGQPTWRRVAYQNDRAIATAGMMDLSLGTRFILGVGGGMVQLSFTNVPAGAVSVVLEINYAAGGFALPAGSMWANGRVPEIAAGKRHLFYFEKCIVGSTAGWYVSALTGFAA